MALITLLELKTAEGVAVGDVDAVRDAKYSQAILGASAAVCNYADRDFGASQVTEQRLFEWDYSGFVDIDDCSTITAVTYSIGGYDTIVTSNMWRAEPYGRPVFTYLVMPPLRGMFFSPAMGFKENLDVLYKERGFVGLGPTLKVDATWGWPAVPDDVKQATIWTAAAMAEKPTPYISESIANYSHTSAIRTQSQEAIPERARDLLAPYVRQLT